VELAAVVEATAGAVLTAGAGELATGGALLGFWQAMAATRPTTVRRPNRERKLEAPMIAIPTTGPGQPGGLGRRGSLASLA